MHHQDYQVSYLLLYSVEHFLDNLNGLVCEELSFILVLVFEGATPEEEPAHEYVSCVTFHIKFGFELVSSGGHDFGTHIVLLLLARE